MTLADTILEARDGELFPEPLPDDIPDPLGNCRECNTHYNWNPLAGEVYCPKCIPAFPDVLGGRWLAGSKHTVETWQCPECGEYPSMSWEHVEIIPLQDSGKKLWQVRRWARLTFNEPAALAHHLWHEHDYRFKDGPLCGNRDFSQPWPWTLHECPIDGTKLEKENGIVSCRNHGAIQAGDLVHAVIHDWHGAIPGTLASEWWMNRKQEDDG
jgi:hypothetical protein